MNATLRTVRASHAAPHARSANIRAPKVESAPKPTAVSAAPTPGTQTAAMTCVNGGLACADGAGAVSRATRSSVTSGSSIVVSAMAVKPNWPYSAVPSGAPAA